MADDVQRLTDQILENARETAESILLKARQSAEARIEQQQELARQRSFDEVSAILKKGEDEAEAVRKTMIADAKKRASWMVLSEKERLVTAVLDEVRRRLITFSQSEKYRPFIEQIIVDAGTILGGGNLEILLCEQDEALPLDLSVLTTKIIEASGKKTTLMIAERKVKSTGGCVVRTLDSKVVIDNTFSDMLRRRERELRLQIANILFRR